MAKKFTDAGIQKLCEGLNKTNKLYTYLHINLKNNMIITDSSLIQLGNTL